MATENQDKSLEPLSLTCDQRLLSLERQLEIELKVGGERRSFIIILMNALVLHTVHIANNIVQALLYHEIICWINNSCKNMGTVQYCIIILYALYGMV